MTDAAGRLRAGIATEPKDGSPQIVLYDAKGAQAAMLALKGDGTRMLALRGLGDKVQADFSITPDSDAAINLRDRKGAAYVGLSCRADGSAALAIKHADGSAQALLGQLPQGWLGLFLTQKGKTRSMMAVRPDGRAAVVIHDKKGKPVWMAPK